MDCLFCKIAAGDIPTKFLYENDRLVAFSDIDPKAPHHILIIPRKHIATINDLDDSHQMLIGEMMLVAKQLADDLGIQEKGYRILMNCNDEGGQAAYHIHMHLLGGRQMNWPPG